jgi:aspartyl-tRNA synthetase
MKGATKNSNIPTGDIEIIVKSFKILNKSAVPSIHHPG